MCQVEETRSLLGKVPTACSREAAYRSAGDRLVSRAFDLANVTNPPSSTADIGPTCSEVANLSPSYPLSTTRRCRFGKGGFFRLGQNFVLCPFARGEGQARAWAIPESRLCRCSGTEARLLGSVTRPFLSWDPQIQEYRGLSRAIKMPRWPSTFTRHSDMLLM